MNYVLLNVLLDAAVAFTHFPDVLKVRLCYSNLRNLIAYLNSYF